MVKVLALRVYLYVSYLRGKTLKMSDRGRPTLKFLSYSAKLAYKATGLADIEISVGYFLHRLLELFLDIASAILTEKAVG
jgi:hypothetical protein